MEPSPKNKSISDLLNEILGANREDTIHSNRCVPSPIGCGQPVTEFRDAISEREYSISGLCQKCQDAFFGS